MQRTFNPQNRARYPGGPPIIAGSSNRRTAPFEGANAGAIPAPAANSRPMVQKDHAAGSLVESHQPSPLHQAEASGLLSRRKDLTRVTGCRLKASARTFDMASSHAPTHGVKAAPDAAVAAYLASACLVTSNIQPWPLIGVRGKIRRPPVFSALSHTGIG